MTDWIRRHPVAAWIVIVLVGWLVGTATVLHAAFLGKTPTAAEVIDMWRITATFFGSMLTLLLGAVLLKLKGL